MNQDELREEIRTICENYREEPTGGWITGNGPIPCDLLFVGEAPGKTEVEEGMPFVGVAGKTFESYLNSIGFKRDQIRITNTCFFRPITIKQLDSGKTSISNRTPKQKEVDLFKDVLNDEISMVNPRIIITMGNVPLKRLTAYKSIGECHGRIFYNEDLRRNIFPMYHPSALTYNRNEPFRKMYADDWNKLKEYLNDIILP